MAPLPPGYACAGYPKVTSLATKILCMFRTTYLVVNKCFLLWTSINKAALNAHLNDILKVVSTQDVTPDIDTLVKAKRYQVSGVGLNR